VWTLDLNSQFRFKKFLKINNDNYWSQHHISILRRVDNKIILDWGYEPGHNITGYNHLRLKPGN